MTGREPKLDNDLFFACAVIEEIARQTKNHRADIVRFIGEKEISRLVELADVLHCEPVENTATELIEKYGIIDGDFDNVADCQYTVPTVFDIAKVYKRLIINIAEGQGLATIDALTTVYSSWLSAKIENYNSSIYFENPQYLYESYLAGEPL